MSLVALANVICDDAFVARFHADPRVQASELLLQERVPREAILSEPRPDDDGESATAVSSSSVYASRRFRSPHTASPHTQFLSNGRYTAAVTHAGGGYSTWRGLAITRQREDRTSDAGSHYIFLRDPWSGYVWSPTYQPICHEPDSYDVTFDLDKVTFDARNGDFETHLQISVSSEDDVEVRRLSIVNRSNRAREIEVTSYAEIVLAPPADDFAHPAFAKLFVETALDAQSSGLLFSRRPRQRRRTGRLGLSCPGCRRPAGRRRRMGDRSRPLHRPWTFAGQPAGDGGAGVVGDDGGGARSDRGATRQGAACARRGRARDLRHGRCDRTRGGADSGSQISRRPRSRRVRSRWHSRTCTRRCSTSD